MNDYSQWTADIPNDPGFYWFWGDLIRGGMGQDYNNPDPVKPEINLVDVRRISNGLMGVSRGHFVNLQKFCRSGRCEGVCGYWLKAELPLPPDDTQEFENALKP